MNVDIMHKIPDTFCPAKWDELYVSFETNYAYSCCKSKPTKFNEHVLEFVRKEQINISNGIKDPSCNYCWSVEQHGGKSLRNQYLDEFDETKFESYTSSKLPALVQVTVGNECNFQCTYCNPKFSSKWEHDVRQREYKVFSDQYFWGIDSKQDNVMEKNIQFLESFDSIYKLSVIGGEPLLNKKLFELLDTTTVQELEIVTNLSCKTSVLDKLFARCSEYKTVSLTVSLDATEKIAEFVRYGLDFEVFDDNFRYLLANRPSNLHVIVGSLMTSITIRDFENFSQYMAQFLDEPNFEWKIEYCAEPKTQSLATLPDQYKASIQLAIDNMSHYNIKGLSALTAVMSSTKFNKVMHHQMKYFMHDFAQRKNIEIPICLD